MMPMSDSIRLRGIGTKVLVHYEDLCTDTHGVLEHICTWIGLPFDESQCARMLDFRRNRHRNVPHTR